jgi:hypothetical protein
MMLLVRANEHLSHFVHSVWDSIHNMELGGLRANRSQGEL